MAIYDTRGSPCRRRRMCVRCLGGHVPRALGAPKKCVAVLPDSSITHAHLGLGRTTPGRTRVRQQAVGPRRPAGDMPAGRCKMNWPSRTVPQCATWPRVRRPQPQAKRLLHHALPRCYFKPIPDPASLTCPLTTNKSSSSDMALYASMQLQASVRPARWRERSTPRETGAQAGRLARASLKKMSSQPLTPAPPPACTSPGAVRVHSSSSRHVCRRPLPKRPCHAARSRPQFAC